VYNMLNKEDSALFVNVCNQRRARGLGMLQAMLQGAGPVGYHNKCEYRTFCLRGVLLRDCLAYRAFLILRRSRS
jgi:hypothetical protein